MNLSRAYHRVFPNQLFQWRWEDWCPNPQVRASSHHKHECEQTIARRGNWTMPTPRGYGWCCHLSEASPHARGGGSTARPHATEVRRMKTAASRVTCHHSESERLICGATWLVRKVIDALLSSQRHWLYLRCWPLIQVNDLSDAGSRRSWWGKCRRLKFLMALVGWKHFWCHCHRGSQHSISIYRLHKIVLASMINMQLRKRIELSLLHFTRSVL
jgi:hypothetical protein